MAYPKLTYAFELGLRFSQFAKSSEYLIQVAQEIIRKRREAQNDPAFVKVWFTMSALRKWVSEWAFTLQHCI